MQGIQKSFSFQYAECPLTSLSPDDTKLIDAAINACDTAYSPYSHFSVGAAVLMQNGSVVAGSNQENIAYPSGLCAERTALFSASVQHPGVPVVALAIVARNEKGLLVEASPCGACRQVLSEYRMRFNVPIKVLMYVSPDCVRVVDDVAFLLPFSFSF